MRHRTGATVAAAALLWSVLAALSPAQAVPAGDQPGDWRAALTEVTVPVREAGDLMGVAYPVSPDHRVRCRIEADYRACTWEYAILPYTYPFVGGLVTSAARFTDADAARAFIEDARSEAGSWTVASRPDSFTLIDPQGKEGDTHIAIRHVRRGSLVLTAACLGMTPRTEDTADCTRTLTDRMLEKWRAARP